MTKLLISHWESVDADGRVYVPFIIDNANLVVLAAADLAPLYITMYFHALL